MLLSAGLSQHHQLQRLHVRLLLSARSKCLHLSQLCWLPSLCNWPPAPQISIHLSWTNLIQVNPDKLSCHDAILQTLLFFLLLFFSHCILSYLLSLSYWFQYIHCNLLSLSWWPFRVQNHTENYCSAKPVLFSKTSTIQQNGSVLPVIGKTLLDSALFYKI